MRIEVGSFQISFEIVSGEIPKNVEAVHAAMAMNTACPMGVFIRAIKIVVNAIMIVVSREMKMYFICPSLVLHCSP